MIQSLVYIPTILGLVLIGAFVIMSNPRDKINQVFVSFVSLISLWLVSLYIADTSHDAGVALFFVRVAIVLSSLYVPLFLYFAAIFPNYKNIVKSRLIIFSILPLIMVGLSFSSLMIGQVKPQPWGAEVSQAGMMYVIQGAYVLFYMAIALVIMLRKAHIARGKEKSQLRIVSFGIGFVLFVNLLTQTVLVSYGVSKYAVLIGTPSFLVLIGAIGYSILKHRLFNIRSLVARSVAYIASIGSFAFIYGFLAFSFSQGVLLKNILTTERSQQIFNIILAVILAFTFPWIRRFFERITDRIFYRDRYDPQILVSDIGRVLATEIELTPLTKKVLQILTSQMRLAEANIVVMNDEGIFYQTHQDKIHQSYHPDDLKLLRGEVAITDELPVTEMRDMLERHNVRAALTLQTKESFVGYLLIGDKRSGDIFTNEDIQTLKIIANELAVAIQNARSYQEIQEFNATLREKVKQATADLRHVNNELKDLDKAKDEFISMASHQLRTPLTAVRGYTSMVMDGDFGKVSKDQRETLKQSFDAATRMVRLVDDLLNVSRIQSGKFHIERTPVDLNKVLPEEVSLLETTAGNKKVTLRFHPPKQPVPSLSLDEGKTRQALMNLMDNAIYYSSTASTGGQVDVTLDQDKDNVIFKVSDNGIGVPKAQQSKLFKKFYRAPNAQKTRPDGTGLGLFLVGKVVQAQGGKIIFESVEGKGSTFGFSLPIKPAGDDLVETPKAGLTSAESDTIQSDQIPAETKISGQSNK